MEDGGRLTFERGFDDAVKEQLAAMGHDIRKATDAHGGYQAIWRTEAPRIYYGGSAPRKDGAALGY